MNKDVLLYPDPDGSGSKSDLVPQDAYKKQGFMKIPTGCSPSGEGGYLNLHWVNFKRMLENISAKAAKA